MQDLGSSLEQVLESKVVQSRKGPKGESKIAECIVGDETGTVVLSIRNELGEPAESSWVVCGPRSVHVALQNSNGH